MNETHLFLDTNVLVHYPAFGGLPWHVKMPPESSIVLHITQPVLEEIAKKKDMGETKRLRKRCDCLVKRIGGFIETEGFARLPSGEFVSVDSASPKMEHFPELNPKSIDDCLLAAALAFKKSTGLTTILVTADVSLSLRAKLRGHQLRNITLDETERLQDEPDPGEIEKR